MKARSEASGQRIAGRPTLHGARISIRSPYLRWGADRPRGRRPLRNSAPSVLSAVREIRRLRLRSSWKREHPGLPRAESSMSCLVGEAFDEERRRARLVPRRRFELAPHHAVAPSEHSAASPRRSRVPGGHRRVDQLGARPRWCSVRRCKLTKGIRVERPGFSKSGRWRHPAPAPAPARPAPGSLRRATSSCSSVEARVLVRDTSASCWREMAVPQMLRCHSTACAPRWT